MSSHGTLALDGGTPVRSERLDYGSWHGLGEFGEEEVQAALRVLRSRSLFRYYGPNLLRTVDAFEASARDLLGCEHAVATSSGTAALRTALAALGVGCGDEVIVPSFTFIASVNAVVTMGAVPVFAEIDESLGLDPRDAEARLTDRTAAIMPVHLDNSACDMDSLLGVARRHGVPVLEDAAQAMGVTYHGQAVGTIGDIGAFSLQLDKNVTAGEGGLVTTSQPVLAIRAARYQDQGGQFVTSTGRTRGTAAVEPFVGENLRMNELAGAIADVQTKRLPDLLRRQRSNRARVLGQLGNLPGCTLRRLADPDGDGGSSLGLFVRDGATARRFIEALRAEGVPAGQMYNGEPVYLTPSIVAKRTASGKGGPWNCAEHPTAVEYRAGLCPTTEALVARSVFVPIRSTYTDRDCDDVAAAVTKVAAALA